MDHWVTQGGADLLPLEEEHCSVVEVTEEDIQNSVKFVPSLSAVVRNPHPPGVGVFAPDMTDRDKKRLSFFLAAHPDHCPLCCECPRFWSEPC